MSNHDFGPSTNDAITCRRCGLSVVTGSYDANCPAGTGHISAAAEQTLRGLYYDRRHIVPDAAHLYEIALACGVEIKT